MRKIVIVNTATEATMTLTITEDKIEVAGTTHSITPTIDSPLWYICDITSGEVLIYGGHPFMVSVEDCKDEEDKE